MAKASPRPRPEWEQLPDSGQRIYLALAEGNLQRARQLYQHDLRRWSGPAVTCGGSWPVAAGWSRGRWPPPRRGSSARHASRPAFGRSPARGGSV